MISVKVITAHIDEREGGKVLLLPLAGKLPRLQLIWVDSGYAGRPFEQWVKDRLGVRVEVVNHPWTGIRGVWVKEGEEVDWNAIIPPGCAPPPPPMGLGTHERVDYSEPSALSRL